MPLQAGKGRFPGSKNIAYRLTGDFNTGTQPIYSWQKLKKRSLLLNSFTALRGGVVRTRLIQLRCFSLEKTYVYYFLKSYILALTLKNFNTQIYHRVNKPC